MVMMRAVDAVFAPLTMITTLSRFAVRGHKKVAFGTDDFFDFLTLLTFCALVGVLKWGKSWSPVNEDVSIYGLVGEDDCSNKRLHFGWSWHSKLLIQPFFSFSKGTCLVS